MDRECSFEIQEIDGKKEAVLCLKDFPEVKFRYKSVRLGSIDEDHQVPMIFDIDLVGDNQTFPEDPEFENQAAQILVNLLDEMLKRKTAIYQLDSKKA